MPDGAGLLIGNNLNEILAKSTFPFLQEIDHILKKCIPGNDRTVKVNEESSTEESARNKKILEELSSLPPNTAIRSNDASRQVKYRS